MQQAAAGELHAWRRSPQGRLAEIIVLDQFSRCIHRGTAQAFAQDPMALVLSQEKFLSLGGYADKIILGTVLIAVLAFFPRGLVGCVEPLRARFARVPDR